MHKYLQASFTNNSFNQEIPVNQVPKEIKRGPIISVSMVQLSKIDTTDINLLSKNNFSKFKGHLFIRNNTNGETNTRPGIRKNPQVNQSSVKRHAYSNILNCSSEVSSTNCDHRTELDPAVIVSIIEAFYPSCYRNIHDYIEKTIFAKFDQTNLTISSTYYSLPLINSSVDNMNIQSGVNFLAYCCSLEFHDAITPVIIPKGYYTDSNGQFTLTEELWELICPNCKQPISGNNVQGIGFRQCNVQVKYRYVDGVTGEIELNVDERNFSFAKLSPPGSVRYHFVKFQIKI